MPPSPFIPHGAPTLPFDDVPVRYLLHGLGVQKPIDILKGFDRWPGENEIAIDLVGPVEPRRALSPVLLARPEKAVVDVTSGLAHVPMAAAHPTNSAREVGSPLPSVRSFAKHRIGLSSGGVRFRSGPKSLSRRWFDPIRV